MLAIGGRSPRRGTAYVFVLCIGMVIACMSFGLMIYARVSARTMPLRNDTAEAEVLARSAIEQAAQSINTNSSWRTTYLSNVATAPVALGRGTISFKLVDETTGILLLNPSNPVRVYGIGRVGSATKVYSAKYDVCGGKPYSCLKVGLAASGGASLGALLTSPSITGGGTISANGLITATATNFNASNLESTLLITATLCAGTGTWSSLAPARTYPDSTVFNYYKSVGTNISYGSTGGNLKSLLLSPSSSPSGGANFRGIYVIDCGGAALQITNARLVATLLVLNTSGVTVQGQVSWEPAIKDYPCLLVQGNLTLNTSGTALTEAQTPAINFNPPGTPYPYNYGASGGTSNTTTTDSYPNQINGLVYCSGNITTSSNPNLNAGVLISGGSWNMSGGSLNLKYDPSYYTSPPPGFTTQMLGPVAGTWRWESAN